MLSYRVHGRVRHRPPIGATMTDHAPTHPDVDGVALADLMSPELASQPQPLYAMLRETAPVMRIDGVGILVTSKPDVEHVLRDPEVFSSNVDVMDMKTK